MVFDRGKALKKRVEREMEFRFGFSAPENIIPPIFRQIRLLFFCGPLTAKVPKFHQKFAKKSTFKNFLPAAPIGSADAIYINIFDDIRQ